MSVYSTINDVIQKENTIIGNQINVTSQQDSTSQSKSNYQNIETIKIQSHNYYLFWIYYTLIIILAYFLYYKSKLDYLYKIAILVGFILYPFLIFPLEMAIYWIINWVWSFFLGKPYM